MYHAGITAHAQNFKSTTWSTSYTAKMNPLEDEGDFCSYLRTKGLEEKLIAVIAENGLTGRLLAETTEADIINLFPRLGDRLAFRRVVAEFEVSC